MCVFIEPQVSWQQLNKFANISFHGDDNRASLDIKRVGRHVKLTQEIHGINSERRIPVNVIFCVMDCQKCYLAIVIGFSEPLNMWVLWTAEAGLTT